jgi:CDP-glycerol glycerophosphotransferase
MSVVPDPLTMSPLAKVRAGLRQLGTRVDPRSVVFASFGGRLSDNPRAIFEELRSRGTSYTSTWVAERADFPEGISTVGPRTGGYAAAVGRAGIVVTNSRLTHYVKKPGVVYLQTWHGTPLKRIGFDNPRFAKDRAGLRRAASDYRRWDFLISQNAYSTEVFRRAFRFDGEVLETGYPRNDVLNASAAPEIRRRTRERMGVHDDRLLVLYAPTFRDEDDSAGIHPAAALDIPRLQSALAPAAHLVIRLHYRDATTMSPFDPSFCTDASAYDDIRDLYLAADVLVTDYSSTMFDFAVTGKPIVFFTYDLARYRDTLRGFYFDLLAEAPGPVTATVDELIETLRSLSTVASGYGEAYARFRDRYCYLDDGHATRRVLDRLFPAG